MLPYLCTHSNNFFPLTLSVFLESRGGEIVKEVVMWQMSTDLKNDEESYKGTILNVFIWPKGHSVWQELNRGKMSWPNVFSSMEKRGGRKTKNDFRQNICVFTEVTWNAGRLKCDYKSNLFHGYKSILKPCTKALKAACVSHININSRRFKGTQWHMWNHYGYAD